MGVARSSHYAASVKTDADAALVAEMREITDAWGMLRIPPGWRELRHRGRVVNSKKVRRLMKLYDLKSAATPAFCQDDR